MRHESGGLEDRGRARCTLCSRPQDAQQFGPRVESRRLLLRAGAGAREPELLGQTGQLQQRVHCGSLVASLLRQTVLEQSRIVRRAVRLVRRVAAFAACVELQELLQLRQILVWIL